MAGRTPHEAVRAFLRPLQLALSCVTKTVIIAGGFTRDDPIGVATLAAGKPVALRSEHKLTLSVLLKFRVLAAEEASRGPWKVTTAAYYYALRDRTGRELISYHWHPEETAAVRHPHLHLGQGSEAIGLLRQAHLPTGRVFLEEVLRLTVTDLDTKPLRRDWWEILAGTEKAARMNRSW